MSSPREEGTAARPNAMASAVRLPGMRGAAALLLTVCALMLLISCGDGDDPEPSGSPSRPSPPLAPSPSVDPVASAEQRAIAAYEGMWAAYDAAGRAPQADPDDPQLARFADGRALEVLVSGLQSLAERGEVIEGEVVLSPEIVELIPPSAPSRVEIEDCGDSSGWLTVDAQTGEVSDSPRGRRQIFATVGDQGDGQWKVVDFAVREVGSCD